MTDHLASEIISLVSNKLRSTNDAAGIFESLIVAVATFIAGANGSPTTHKFACDQFHARLLIETPKARHRLNQIARQSHG